MLFGSPPYGDAAPAVSFTESRIPDLEYLFSQGLFDPWGVVVTRDDVFGNGGAPVWSVWTDVIDTIPNDLRVWTARLEPGQSEWLHEREWRIPANELRLGPPAVRAVIVGDPNWRPSRTAQDINPRTGRQAYVDQVPTLSAGLTRWWWNQWCWRHLDHWCRY